MRLELTGVGGRWKGKPGGVTRVALLAVLALMLAIATPGWAQIGSSGPTGATSTKDVLVAVRTIGFVANPPSGAVDLAVVYDPAQQASLQDLKTITAALSNGVRVGAAQVRPVPIPVTELARLSGFRFVLLTGGLQHWTEAVAALARGHGMLTISTDLACVRAGQCVMGVAAEPRVQVLVNRTASEAAGVEFAVSFRMMITEL